MGGGLRRRLAASILLALPALPAAAQLAPPGVLRSVTVPSGEWVSFPLPFEPSAANVEEGFSGQANAAYRVFHWNAPRQTWNAALHLPSAEWRGDDIPLRAGDPVLLQNPGASPRTFYLGGVLPTEPLRVPVYPGLTRLASPLLEPVDIEEWTPELKRRGRFFPFIGWMVLYNEANRPVAFRGPGSGANRWHPLGADEILSLSPDESYFLFHFGWSVIPFRADVAEGSDPDALPAVRAVVYDAGIQRARLDVETDGSPGALVDIMVRDVHFTAESEPDEAWTVLARRVPANGQTTLEIEDPAPPQQDGARLYLVADANLDSDGDGLSDALETHVTGTDPQNPDTNGNGIGDAEEWQGEDAPAESEPDSDGEGMTDAYEIEHGYDPNRPDHPDVEFRVFTPLR